MKALSRMKTLYLSLFSILILNTPVAFSQKAEEMRGGIYFVYSLNSDSTLFYATTIIIDTAWDVAVSTKSRPALPTDAISIRIIAPIAYYKITAGPGILTYTALE